MQALKRWLKRAAIGLVVVLAVAAAAGFAYERIGRIRDRSSPPGVLVDVGGFRLQLYCKGTGSPAVILDTGLGLASPTWGPVQNAVSAKTRACSYDRAGYQWSDAGPEPRTSDRIAAELHTLLERAGEKPPFVVVGHSFGGYNMRVFAHEYPAEVVGMVLVDSSHEDQQQRPPKSVASPPAMLLVALRTASELGVMRLLGQPTPSATYAELAGLTASADATRKARDFGSLPLVVLTAGQIDTGLMPGVTPDDLSAYRNVWQNELQPDLARLSTRGEQRIVADSSHVIPILKPQAVVDAIDSVLEAAGGER